MSKILTDGVPVPFSVPFKEVPLKRENLLRSAAYTLIEEDEDFDGFAYKPPSRCFSYFFELAKRNVMIGANADRESQHVTMARLALDKGAPRGEREAAASAFFRFARKNNVTAEAIVSITHPPEPQPEVIIAYTPEAAEETEVSKKDWHDSIWGRVVGFVIVIAFIFLAGVVMFPVHTLIAPGVVETHYSIWGGLMPFIWLGSLILLQGLFFVVICPCFMLCRWLTNLAKANIR